VRFNQRFNGIAPEWQADPKLGRGLEDYALAIGRIQRAWPSPLDAIAELEALLFRRGPEAEFFDLPAYHDVVFLYLIARDLHAMVDRGGVDDVDVLLPIGGRSAQIAAPAGTIVLRAEFNDGDPVSLDLDLTTRQAALAQREPEAPAEDGGDQRGGNADPPR
jgi:pilus assembly protein FimV